MAVPAPWTVTCAVLSVWPAALMDMFSVDCDGLPEAITDTRGQTTPSYNGRRPLLDCPGLRLVTAT